MRTCTISTTEVRSPAEDSLDAIIENFNGFVQSIDGDLQYIILNIDFERDSFEGLTSHMVSRGPNDPEEVDESTAVPGLKI